MTDAFKSKQKRKHKHTISSYLSQIDNQLRPISERLRRVRLDPKYFLSLFKDVLPEK